MRIDRRGTHRRRSCASGDVGAPPRGVGRPREPGEEVEDFALRLTNLMEQMARNDGIDLTEERTVEKFLRCMLKKYA